MGRRSISLAELRDWLTLSWKYTQAILEYYDRPELTKRVEDQHVFAKRAGG